MTALSREVGYVQNPALGAVLIWRFVAGYQSESKTAAPAPMPLAFVVLPLVLHADSFEHLAGTRTGLRGFADKFVQSANPSEDFILAIHARIDSWRGLSLDSLRIAIRARLISVTPKTAGLLSLSARAPTAAPEPIRPMLRASEKLGRWCAELSLFEVASLLRVVF